MKKPSTTLESRGGLVSRPEPEGVRYRLPGKEAPPSDKKNFLQSNPALVWLKTAEVHALKIRFLTILSLLALTLPVLASPNYEALEYRGETFNPQLHPQGERVAFRLDDPEIVRLLSYSTSQFQWSSSGLTLYVFTPGRESFWSHDSEVVSVNRQDLQAPGRLWVDEEGRFMEPEALLFALSLKAFEGEEATILMPVVTALEEKLNEQTGLHEMVVRTSSPIRPELETLEDGVVRLDLGDVVWDLPQRELVRGRSVVKVEGGLGPEAPLSLFVYYPKNWTGRLDNSSLLNDVKLSPLADFPVAEQAPIGQITSLEQARFSTGEGTVFHLEQPVQYFWSFDPASRFLTVEIPHTQPLEDVQIPEDFGLEEATLTTVVSGYPILRLEGKLPEGKVFEFFEPEEVSSSLALLVKPGQEVAQATGSASTEGYSVARGTIVIDPGHGGSDPGCVNRQLGVREADVTLKISLQLAEVLRQQGWTVVLTRTSDRDVTYAGSPDKEELVARSDVANAIDADIFVSIHCNAAYQSYHNGTSIHWYKAEDYQLAQSLEHVLGTTVGFGQKGLIRNRFVVLRYAEMPSVLVETAYLTNPREGAMLSNPKMHKLIAQQLAGGLTSYLQGVYASRSRRTQ